MMGPLAWGGGVVVCSACTYLRLFIIFQRRLDECALPSAHCAVLYCPPHTECVAETPDHVSHYRSHYFTMPFPLDPAGLPSCAARTACPQLHPDPTESTSIWSVSTRTDTSRARKGCRLDSAPLELRRPESPAISSFMERR